MIGRHTENYALHEMQRVYDDRAALHARQSASLRAMSQLRVLARSGRLVALLSQGLG